MRCCFCAVCGAEGGLWGGFRALFLSLSVDGVVDRFWGEGSRGGLVASPPVAEH